jgi:tetratricopeptide (TPR) repeat protein
MRFLSDRRWMLACVLMLCPLWANAQSPRERFDAAVKELAKAPADHAKRQAMLELLRDVNPKPATPPEAERFDGRAQYAFKNAASEAEMLEAAREYLKAVEAAPWVADYYFNLCTILEKAKRPAEAIRACKFYLAGAPDATDASEIRKRIAGLDFALERARSNVTRRKSCADNRNYYEAGAKLATINGRRISAKLISSLYGGAWRNQLMLTDMTSGGPGSAQRKNLDPVNQVFRHDDRVPGTPWFRLVIERDGRISFGAQASAQAEIVTSIAELQRMRNEQLNGCTLAVKDGKFFLELGQGGPTAANDGAKVAGTLYFEADCTGKLLGDKPGWHPTLFVPWGESAPDEGTDLAVRRAPADACRRASNDRLGWLAL